MDNVKHPEWRKGYKSDGTPTYKKVIYIWDNGDESLCFETEPLYEYEGLTEQKGGYYFERSMDYFPKLSTLTYLLTGKYHFLSTLKEKGIPYDDYV